MKIFGIMLVVFIVLISMQIVSAQCVPPPEGIVAWWPGDGNADDIIGNNSSVIIENLTLFDQGYVGRAFNFTGQPEYILVPAFNATTPQLTYEAWILL